MAAGVGGGEALLEALAQLGVHHAVEILEIEPGARAVRESPITLDLRRKTGATVIAAVREGRVLHNPDPAFHFAPGDTVVLAGDDEALAQARPLFLGSGAKPPADA
jgi:K+/H+ antiporter YhaU regulatory subunit KhtT